MPDLEPLRARNAHFAATDSFAGVPVYPKQGVCLITCLDPRTDPANFLELTAGEAIVIRNAGWRVTQAQLDDHSYITYLSETVFRPEGDLFEVVVIHHTRCGTSFLADEDFRKGYVAHVHGDDVALRAEAVTDPESSVRHDVHLLLASPTISPKVTVSGFVYDVDTGLLTTVVPTSRMPNA